MENINYEEFNYYSVIHPKSDELVLVIFNDQKDAFFGILVEYSNYKCIMTFQSAIKKKKISSWNKIVPMNKILIVKIIDVDTTNKIVQVSMAYLGDNFKEELDRNQLQDKLMKPFIENKILESFIKSVCIINNLYFKDIWTSLVYHIDELRREINENDENDENIFSLWKYFTTNIADIDIWIKNCELDETIGIVIKELYQKRTKEIPKKITSKIGIISLGGVNPTKELISNVLSQFKYPYSFRYDTAPYYLLESSTEDFNIDYHNKFIKTLEIESVKFNPKIFIKSNFIGKISIN